MPTQNGTQPQPPLHQRPPPPRHALSEGGSQTRFQRSDSAPPYPQQSSTTMMGSLVVNLGRQTNLVENRNIAQGPAERSRFPPTSPLPPPPAPKSVCRVSHLFLSKEPSKWDVCVCIRGAGRLSKFELGCTCATRCKLLGALLKILGAQLIMLGASISEGKVESSTVPRLFVIFSLLLLFQSRD